MLNTLQSASLCVNIISVATKLLDYSSKRIETIVNVNVWMTITLALKTFRHHCIAMSWKMWSRRTELVFVSSLKPTWLHILSGYHTAAQWTASIDDPCLLSHVITWKWSALLYICILTLVFIFAHILCRSHTRLEKVVSTSDCFMFVSVWMSVNQRGTVFKNKEKEQGSR